MNIILASQSTARKRALDILGIKYRCIPAQIDEKAIRNTDPFKMAIAISEAKAYAVASKETGIIIASDAFLFFDGKVLEKPTSLDEAKLMLKQLSGQHHTFITGLAVYDTQSEKMRSAVSGCDIYFRDLSDKEISDYCETYPVLTFASGFDADGVIRFSTKIEGACNFITAMPMEELVQFLKELNA